MENFKSTLNYDHITLTDEELQQAILMAKRLKHTQIQTDEYWKKVIEPPKYPNYTPEQFLQIIKRLSQERFGFDFEVTDDKIINSLLSYFCNNPGDYNLNKGVMLQGTVGCGKTTLMRLLSQNQKASFIVVSCRKVAQDYAEHGYEGIKKYFTNHKVALNSNPFGHKEVGYCFDDLGTESDKKNFGNELNAMAEVILNRYDSSSLVGMTHITTNLSGDEIEDLYGTRVKSRLREMVNQYQFIDAIDLRK